RGRGYLTEQEDFPQAAASGPRDMEGAFGGAGDAVDDSPGNEGTLYSESDPDGITGKIALRQVNIQPDASGNGIGETGAIRAAASSVTDAPRVLHRPSPYNLASLRDLYTQIPDISGHLTRFGSD